MSGAALYCVMQQMRREREARAAIGVPAIVTVQPLIPGEHEAWVAIGVPLIEPRPQRNRSPCEKLLMRVRCTLDQTRWIFSNSEHL